MNRYSPTPIRLNAGLVLSRRVRGGGHYKADVVGTMTPTKAAVIPHYSSRRTASSLVSLHDECRSKGEASTALLSLTRVTVDGPMQLRICAKANQTPRSIEEDIEEFKERHQRKHAETSKFRRREQCRTNQARYRDKQRNVQLALDKAVEHLHQELDVLKRKYRDASSHERSNRSPWSIAAEVFRLIETSFRLPWSISSTQEMKNHAETWQVMAILERAFAHDVAMGELRGVDALMEQLRLYSHCFGEPNLQLQRIESVGPVTAAHAKLSLTVTELTLQHVFPHLAGKKAGECQAEDGREQLYQRLLGQRLECSCLVSFLFDNDRYRVVRLATSIDMIPALLRVLRSLRDVSTVLEHAQVSLESVIGEARYC